MIQNIASIDNLLNSLNEAQKEVVYSSSRRLLCLAGAGTGKTHTIICKLLYSTEILKVDPQSILCLTFTNAAGEEMKSRFSMYSSLASSPAFGTFHSFCYNLLATDQNICKKLGYSRVPDIIDEAQESNYHTKAQMLSSTHLSKPKCKITYQPASKEKFEYQVFQKALDKLLRKDNKITFDRLCYRICELFSSNDSLIQKYLQQYKYLYVDEFQDTDPLQWKFVQAFLNYSTIVVVGDIRQAIYQFRGCSSDIIKRIAKNSEWSLIKLETNYRSTQQICDYANRFVEKYKDDVERIQLAATKSGPDIRHMNINMFNNHLKLGLDDKYATCAILCRTNREVQVLAEKLDALKISYSTKANTSLAVLAACALHDKYREDFLISQLNEADRSNVISRMYFDKSYHPLQMLELRFPDIMQEIEAIKDSDEFGQIQILHELGELKLSDLTSSPVKDLQKLYVGTIHSVKGLEFESVYVYGVNSETFKVMKSEELMNLYYVAITRARTQLTLITGDIEYNPIFR